MEWFLANAGRVYVHDADLVAVATHGWDQYSGVNHIGWVTARQCYNFSAAEMYSDFYDLDVDIYLLQICDIYETDNVGNWYTFRNLHYSSAPVSAGCWGDCAMSTSGDASTFGIVADSLLDSYLPVSWAWLDGHDITSYDDDIIAIGSGGLGMGGTDSCLWRAGYVSWYNREYYQGPLYWYNQPWPVNYGDPELCGYYWDNA
jgi:hypothetical protein